MRQYVSDSMPLPPDHERYRAMNWSHLTGSEALTRICAEVCTVDEDKVGPQLHLPAMPFLSQPEHPRPYQPDQGPVDYLFVLGSPHPLDEQARMPLFPGTTAARVICLAVEEAGLDPKRIVVTHAMRFVLPKHVKTYSQRHKTCGRPYVLEDVLRTRPKVIVCFGADALKAVLGPTAKLDTYRGAIVPVRVGSAQTGHDAVVVPTVTPLEFARSHAGLGVFRSEILRAREIVEGNFRMSRPAQDYRVVTGVDKVQALLQEIRDKKPRHISFDTEFGSDLARDEYNYALSVQFSWGPGAAAVVPLRTHVPQPAYEVTEEYGRKRKDGTKATRTKTVQPGPKLGVPIYAEADEATIWAGMQALLLDRAWRIDAHHLRVDVQTFARAGYPIDARVEDGFDTMLVHHLLCGDEEQGLDHLVRKYRPGFGAYWAELEEWLAEAGKDAQLRFGYRNIPPEILYPYALDDAAVTWLIAEDLEAELEKQPRLKHLYWSHVAPTSLHLLDVERHGILVDEDQRTRMREYYTPIYDDLLNRIRTLVNWPEFNPRSDDNVCSLLFSTTPYRDKKTAPDGVKVLALDPLVNTDKYPRMWAEIKERGDEHLNAPSVKAVNIEVMSHQHEDVVELKLLRYLSVLGKFLTTYLAPIELNEFGVPEGGKGFHNNIWANGRVRTRLSQLTQTGRYTSQAANLQTQPKKQEAVIFEAVIWSRFGIDTKEYKRRTFDGKPNKDKTGWEPGKEPYTGPDRIPEDQRPDAVSFKTCLVAKPGYSLVEVDFKNAEIFIWAYCSGDPDLIAIVDSGRDLHSEVACSAFQLPPLATMAAAIAALKAGNKAAYKQWNDEFKKEYESQRVGAKTVNFGIMYGRSAPALSREIQKTGIPSSAEECQAIIDSVAKQFPVAWKWLQKNKNFAVTHEYVETPFGRRRYFTGISQMSDMDKAAVKREASNSPIQGAVADLLAQAGIAFYRFRHGPLGHRVDFEILLPIHDAFLFECRDEHVEAFKKVITYCMSTMNKIPGTNYSLGVDITVMKTWGDH